MRILFLLCFCLSIVTVAHAQDPLRFKDEVTRLTAGDSAVNKKKLILFTGSSSVRLWKDLASYYPKKNVLNRGFGGSITSELVYYFDQLILPYQAKKIFIYEGDNDLASGVDIKTIMAANDTLLKLIRSKVSKKVKVYFISPKPSLARKALKENYLAYNKTLKAWIDQQKNVTFIDVWPVLTDEKGDVKTDIFVSDGLHLNKKGYDLWSAEIGKHL
jgi:lysophospholipase L1-like esterase